MRKLAISSVTLYSQRFDQGQCYRIYYHLISCLFQSLPRCLLKTLLKVSQTGIQGQLEVPLFTYSFNFLNIDTFLPCKKKKKFRGLNVEDLTLNKISKKSNFLLCPIISANQESANTPCSL